jgi:hypothetical protein
VKFECYEISADCAADDDADLFNVCIDCDDTDSSVTDECYIADEGSCLIDLLSCDNEFQCKLIADADKNDELETDNVACVDGCCEIVE